MNEDSKNEVVLLSGDGSEVSLQLYQDVYASLNRGQEQIRHVLYEKHHLKLNDLVNLHSQVAQLIEQYDCKQSGCTVRVQFSDSYNENYSSFERFKIQSGTKFCCVESVFLEYDFFILLPKSREARPYKVRISLASQVGILDRLNRTSASDVERRMTNDFLNFTAFCEIDYVDVAVARSIESQIVTWYKSIPKSKGTYNQKISQSISNDVDVVARLAGFLALVILAISYLAPMAKDFGTTFKAIAIFAVSISIVQTVGFALGRWSGRFFSKIREHSFIEFSQADVDAKVSVQHSVVMAVCSGLIAIAATIALGLSTSWVGTLLGM